MSEVVVFVDDAVQGRFPDICVKDGVPARGRLRVIKDVNGSNRIGILWLLLLLGPLGWIALLLVLGTRSGGEQLVLKLPYSDAAYDRFTRARRFRTLALAVGVCGTAVLLLLTAWARLGLSGVVLSVVAAIVATTVAVLAEVRFIETTVDVRLDASRRWVTLGRVHPMFASSAVDETFSAREQRADSET